MNLLYAVAFGAEEYFQCADLMFRSARRAGFTGECALISDRAYAFDSAVDVRVHVHGRDAAAKTVIQRYETLSCYSRILHADTDILFLKNPDTELPIERGAPPLFACTALPLRIFPYNLQFFTDGERQAIPQGRRSLNTCFFSLPAEGAATFLSTWGRFHGEVREPIGGSDYNILRDQPALEALRHRGILDFKLMPPEWVYWPATTHARGLRETAVISHYTGFTPDKEGKSRLFDMMSRDFKVLCPG